uniref:DNA damage-inducible transcript 4-like protein n=1 Tax=Ornithorhynchus anatinus TaxID=9258 RepID=F6YVX5_ORNAN
SSVIDFNVSLSPPVDCKFLEGRYHDHQAVHAVNADSGDHGPPDPALHEAAVEETPHQSLVRVLESCLSGSKRTKLGCSRLLLPEKLTHRVARDVLRLSAAEPCGLRGCLLHVHLEADRAWKRLDSIVWDADIVPTFELTLVFKQEGRSGSSLGDFFRPGARRTLVLGPGFRLVKRKLYSVIGTVVEEC